MRKVRIRSQLKCKLRRFAVLLKLLCPRVKTLIKQRFVVGIMFLRGIPTVIKIIILIRFRILLISIIVIIVIFEFLAGNQNGRLLLFLLSWAILMLLLILTILTVSFWMMIMILLSAVILLLQDIKQSGILSCYVSARFIHIFFGTFCFLSTFSWAGCIHVSIDEESCKKWW